MQRSSKYFQLKYVVEGKRAGSGFYEPIAAFDVQSIAKDYAHSCYLDKQNTGGIAAHFKYQVVERMRGKGSADAFKIIASYPAKV